MCPSTRWSHECTTRHTSVELSSWFVSAVHCMSGSNHSTHSNHSNDNLLDNSSDNCTLGVECRGNHQLFFLTCVDREPARQSDKWQSNSSNCPKPPPIHHLHTCAPYHHHVWQSPPPILCGPHRPRPKHVRGRTMHAKYLSSSASYHLPCAQGANFAHLACRGTTLQGRLDRLIHQLNPQVAWQRSKVLAPQVYHEEWPCAAADLGQQGSMTALDMELRCFARFACFSVGGERCDQTHQTKLLYSSICQAGQSCVRHQLAEIACLAELCCFPEWRFRQLSVLTLDLLSSHQYLLKCR